MLLRYFDMHSKTGPLCKGRRVLRVVSVSHTEEEAVFWQIMRTGHEGWPVSVRAAQAEHSKSYFRVSGGEVDIIA